MERHQSRFLGVTEFDQCSSRGNAAMRRRIGTTAFVSHCRLISAPLSDSSNCRSNARPALVEVAQNIILTRALSFPSSSSVGDINPDHPEIVANCPYYLIGMD
uniref:Uncharacterized protein n=1 Tax=Plectus sambesii TaxID=2011161 RepID=A0A914V349_9BILA